ncbi:MAG: serine/threonine protein kinase [Myxococcales bacterium]|nr:serine/threonine protein kinase [Myxococcales bacterium]MBP6842815.1 serine/threonine protein kinase [Kofleriaceae bacterium]
MCAARPDQSDASDAVPWGDATARPGPSRSCPTCGARTASPFCPRDGSVLQAFSVDGRYRVEELLGAGGMAFVFGGRHVGLGREVAIKVLRPERASDAGELQRFLREARTVCELSHPGIAGVLDVARDAELDLTYLVMERVRGVTLAELLRREGRLPWPRAVGILVQVTRAMAVAHELGIVHRDLSPRNVMLTSTSRALDVVKVCDFGLSRHTSGDDRITATGAFLGTPAYMAPEQVAGEAIDHRADLYAIGAIGYEMVAGALPLHATSGALIAAKLNREPQALRERFPELDVPIALEELLRATLAREPTRRPRDAEAMTRTLVAIATSATDVGGSVDLIGRSVGSYEVKRLLGVGGTGSVYLAEHPLIGMRVAVKILAPELASNSEFVERFIREARGSNAIGSPNIPRYYDFGRLADGRPFAIMEYLTGETLATRLERDGVLPLTTVAEILTQVATAMEEAHAAGIIHRDLKPENLFLCSSDAGALQVKVLDFGIAKLLDGGGGDDRTTRVGFFMGTPLYCAPEQVYGGDVSPATDVYALGVVAFEALAGRPPFVGEISEIVAAKLGKQAVLADHCPHLPAAVSDDVAAMMTASLTARVATMAELRARVMAWRFDDARRTIDMPVATRRAGPLARGTTSPPAVGAAARPISEPVAPIGDIFAATASGPSRIEAPRGPTVSALPTHAEPDAPEAPVVHDAPRRRGMLVAACGAVVACVVLAAVLMRGDASKPSRARPPAPAAARPSDAPVVKSQAASVDAGVASAPAVDAAPAAAAPESKPPAVPPKALDVSAGSGGGKSGGGKAGGAKAGGAKAGGGKAGGAKAGGGKAGGGKAGSGGAGSDDVIIIDPFAK